MSKPNLFDHNYNLPLPPQDECPLNIRQQARTVRDILSADIRNAKDYLIVTGFTSLSNLIAVFGATDYPTLDKLRVLIGFDPDERVGRRLPHYSLPLEIRNYWLKQNVSIMLCGPILNIIEKIKQGKYEFRTKDKMHAKMYISNKAAILGSSNFSHSGTMTQLEANVRVRNLSEGHEQQQYDYFRQTAEFYYENGAEYNQELIALLKKLLKEATWEEALARSISEILDNKWMKDYPELYNALVTHELWPSQRIGIARAMKIIQDQGRVLIADPTGSGKTKLVTALVYTVHHWMWENGARRKSNALIICPKQVMDNWEREEAHFNYFNKIDSMGKLSLGKSQKLLQKGIENTDLLVIDEAHNYLHPGSQRSRAINPKGSTNVMLVTGTPINKKPEDLLRLVELLDIDNLSDEDLNTYLELRRQGKRRKLDSEHLGKLKNYVTKFILRRTKKELNSMIDRELDLYKNSNGLKCRYPHTKPEVYATGETDKDKRIAEQIYELAAGLKGIHYLQGLSIPPEVRREEDKRALIKRRFASAPALAAYMVHSSLRSSRCALTEYLHGTEAANIQFGLNCTKNPTGNIVQKIEKYQLSTPKIQVPIHLLSDEQRWLYDEKRYKEECLKELNIYREITELVKQVSPGRELGKAKELIKKAKEYRRVLAFDTTVITLDYIDKLVKEAGSDVTTIVATGQKEANKSKVKDSFQLGNSAAEALIALCSDAMAEGINLQGSKALVMLDIPSVLRLAEQRIGRLERMDSEHKEIFIFWPDDSDAFSLKRDRRLIDILRITEDLIGNNVEIPDELYRKHLSDDLSTRGIIKAVAEYSEREMEWEEVKDNTQFLYGLKEGKGALISEETYKELRDVEATVKTAISFVESDGNWAFFCFRGSARSSPKWLFIDERNNAHTDFGEIAQRLKQRLGNGKVIQRKWGEVKVTEELKRVVKVLRRHERELLPWKKKRALTVAEALLIRIKDDATAGNGMKGKADRLIQMLKNEEQEENFVDLDHMADMWLDILVPELDKMKNEQIRKRRILTLRDLVKKRDLRLQEQQLDDLLANCQYASTLDEMIAACIIGVRDQGEEGL